MAKTSTIITAVLVALAASRIKWSLLVPPQPLPDRLAQISDDAVTIDNVYYDDTEFTWEDEDMPLKRFNTARVPYFLDAFEKVLERDVMMDGKFGDVGCGGGLVTEALAKEGLDITGVDMSPRSIHAARVRAAEKSLRVNYTVGSAYSLPFDTDSLDGLVSSDVLEHLFDLPQFFSEVSRVLRPGGVFVFDTITRTRFSYYVIYLLAQEVTDIVPRGTHAYEMFVTPEEVAQGLQKVGMTMADKAEIKGMRPTLKVAPWGKLFKGTAWLGDWVAFDGLDGSYAWYAVAK